MKELDQLGYRYQPTPKDPLKVVPKENLDDFCLHEVFEAQVVTHPDRAALVTPEGIISYKEMDVRANRIAQYLHANGIGPGQFVGLFFERSELPVIAMMGVLKSGAAYIPLDPVYPADRIAYILETTEMSLLLTQDSLWERLPKGAQSIAKSMDDEQRVINQFPIAALTREETGITPNELCYILFTSGTTGRPKGIMTEHRNVVRFALSFNKTIRLTSEDRVYQGFSVGFDGSVEEMWMAFSNGAALVMSSPEAAHQPDEAARIIEEYQASVFSTVPTFLGMITRELPNLKLLIVSGEACPPPLVDQWARDGRRMLNVYGPTETTVNSTAAECLPGEPISIGQALEGYDLHLLDQNHKILNGPGKGELFIGGVGVARGYFSQPELSQKSFLEPSDFELSGERLYRTGDLVSRDEVGNYFFHGRIDTQVKVRGYRVELAEIESVLRAWPQIKHAVCSVTNIKGFQELAGYIVLEEGCDGIERSALHRAISEQLVPYMVPSYLDQLESIPLTASGKVDRKALPDPQESFVGASTDVIPPETATEAKLERVWAATFQQEEVSIEDDFFTVLGGYSLLVVEMLTKLRSDHGIEVSVRDAYRYKTIKSLGAFIDQESSKAKIAVDAPQRRKAEEVFAAQSPWERNTVKTLQALSLLWFYGSWSVTFGAFLWTVYAAFMETFSWWIPGGIFLYFMVLGYPTLLVTSLAIKWLVVGRYKVGRYPLYSFYYFRFWFASRAQAASGITLMSGTPVMNLYFRLMGAKVGAGALIDTGSAIIYDHLHIGSESSIGSETNISGFRVEDGELIIGSISIGDRCFVGTHSSLGLGSKMNDDSALDDLSALGDLEEIPQGETWKGSPAKSDVVRLPNIKQHTLKKRRPILFSLLHLAGLEVLGLISLAIALPFFGALIASFYYYSWTGLVTYLLVGTTFGTLIFCLFTPVVKRLIQPKVESGIYDLHSLWYVRKWMTDVILSVSRTALHSLYTTIYFPGWLRLMGAKVGKRAEISTVSQLYPDLTEIGDESFFADGSMIGGRKFYRGFVELATTSVGKRSFVGNNARLAVGESLGDHGLLGVLSSVPTGTLSTPDHTEWLGSPSFNLPHRVKNEEFSLEETYKPSFKLYVQRCIIDGLRILIPSYLGVGAFAAFIAYLYFGITHFDLLPVLALLPVVSTTIAFLVALAIVMLKWGLMGTFKPVRKPLWSVYVWNNELLNGVYETVSAPIIAPLMGTPFFNWYLRALGCKIGKHSYIGTSLFSEFDLVHIGDHCTLGAGVIIQNHLFEDRVMKSSHLYLENNVTVAHMAVVLYDSRIKQGTRVSPLSLVMKGETLPENSSWTGSPVAQD
jgi:non-ribosomal peptide synthetase-like protein